MKRKTTSLLALLLLCMELAILHGQEAVVTSGGDGSGTTGTVSYSVGQVACYTNTGTSGVVTQGIQQPYEILVVNSIEKGKGLNLEYSVYPNPAMESVRLKIEGGSALHPSKLTFQLFDINGSLLLEKKITSNETAIPIETLKPSTYFLKITDNKKEIRIFKIVKK